MKAPRILLKARIGNRVRFIKMASTHNSHMGLIIDIARGVTRDPIYVFKCDCDAVLRLRAGDIRLV